MTPDRFGIVGKVVARTYQVEEVVAEGGFGVVYRAYHKGFRAKVALKCLKIPDELTEQQRQSFLEQFRSEAEVLFRLSGQIPNIVRPLHVDAFRADDGRLVPFMALEWLDGRTLDAVILRRTERGRPPLSLAKLVRLLTPVASALEQAHHLQTDSGVLSVVHRDMKPENLFIARVGEEDVAKILDFGISKVKSTASQLAGKQSQTESAFVSFSPAYGAPEQWAPRRFGGTGRWTDVWGLALTVVEAAKGSEVVSGDHAAMMGTIIDPSRRPTPRAEGLEVSDAVEAVFLRALAVDPRDRYQTVGAFWDELTAALGLQRELGAVSARAGDLSPKRRGKSTDGFDSILPPAGEASSEPLPPPPRAPRAPRAAGNAPLHAAATEAASGGPRVLLESVLDTPSRPGGVPRPPAPRSAGSGRRPVRGEPPSLEALPVAAGLGAALELEKVSQRPRPPSPSLSAQATLRRRPSLARALGPSIALAALSVAFTVLDRAFALKHGVPLSVLGVKATWVAGLLFIVALGLGYGAVRRTLD
jgi:serine/threonine-protein kinase